MSSATFLKTMKASLQNNELDTFKNQVQTLSKKHQPHAYPLPAPSSLSLEGGGPRGRLYISALEALSSLELLPNVKTVAGTSVGAIFGFLLGLGFNARQIREIGEDINFADLMDFRSSKMGDWFSGTWLHKIASLSYREYMHTGVIFHFWAEHLLEEILGSPDASFADLHALVVSGKYPHLKDLIFTATHAKEDTVQVFSYETTPHARIADGLRASISLPGVLQVATVRNKDGSELGKFVDGGVKINNPINLLDKIHFTHPNYPLQSVKSSSENKAINPSSLGLSLSWRYQLDENITPINQAVQQEIEKHKQENALIVKAQNKGALWLQWLRTKKQNVAGFLQHYKYKYWKFYDLGDIFRHIISFNIGLPKFDKEDRKQKLKDHLPNVIQIWNLDIQPHETEFTEKQKQRADVVGRETVYSWWEHHHRPNHAYQGQYSDLFSDYQSHNLKALLKAFLEELEKYENQNLQIRGYSPAEFYNNTKILFLSNQLSKLIPVCSEAEFAAALQEAKNQIAQHKVSLSETEKKQDCYLEKVFLQKMITAVDTKDNEKFKRAYHAQLGKGLHRLTMPSPVQSSNILQYIMQKGEPSTLETALSLAKESIQQAIQQGKKAPFSSIVDFLEKNDIDSLYQIANQHPHPEMKTVLDKYYPKKHTTKSMLKVIQTSFVSFSSKITSRSTSTAKVIPQQKLSPG